MRGSYYQSPSEGLMRTDCNPKDGCFLDVFWAWDRSLGAWVHYPVEVIPFPATP